MMDEARALVGEFPKDARAEQLPGDPLAWKSASTTFLVERLRYVFEQRGYTYDELNAVFASRTGVPDPLDARRRLEGLRAVRGSADFEALAVAFKRVKNLSRELRREPLARLDRLTEPAELALLAEFDRRAASMREAIRNRAYDRACRIASGFRPAVDRFFTDIFVMVDDEDLRDQRLTLLWRLHELLLELADISEIAPKTES
jgi:glycyl-tRNA synthetase beta chain